VAALISLGTPADVAGQAYGYDFLRECAKPKLFVSGARDEFGPPGEVERVVAGAAEPKLLVRIPEADHFFEGHLLALERTVVDWVRATLPETKQPL
jgi:alpha/beta superfamily hydrolase